MSKSSKPTGAKDGKHRRASEKAHSDSIDGTSESPGRAFSTDPATSAIPYAGIRTGEIIGYRLWWVVEEEGEYWISSLAHRRLWKPGETIHGDVYEWVGDVWVTPSLNIPGGVYSYYSQDLLNNEIKVHERSLAYLWHMKDQLGADKFSQRFIAIKGFVSGTIKMWGDVVEHLTGWRAEYAKLVSLDYGVGSCDLEKLRAKYFR